jgi:hypothetical protein
LPLFGGHAAAVKDGVEIVASGAGGAEQPGVLVIRKKAVHFGAGEKGHIHARRELEIRLTRLRRLFLSREAEGFGGNFVRPRRNGNFIAAVVLRIARNGQNPSGRFDDSPTNGLARAIGHHTADRNVRSEGRGCQKHHDEQCEKNQAGFLYELAHLFPSFDWFPLPAKILRLAPRNNSFEWRVVYNPEGR